MRNNPRRQREALRGARRPAGRSHAQAALGVVLVLFASAGCRREAGRGVALCRPAPAPNLLYGDPDVDLLAGALTGRSSWPSVPVGYDFDRVESYSQITVDTQLDYAYSGLGDQFYRESVSFRSGTRLR